MKIRTKLLMIYFFCVLIPIILTDAIILYTVNRNSREDKVREIQFLMDRIAYNMKETIESCFLFTNGLYLDQHLDEFLERDFADGVTYYSQYMEFLEYNNLGYNYTNSKLSKIHIFADNNTIINGGKIATVDMIRDTHWYQSFKESGENMQLYVHYDDSKRNAIGRGTARTISIIRSLNNYGDNKIEKLVKVDIDYNNMLKDVLNEKIDADIYVKNKDYILFSNKPNQSILEPYSLSSTIEYNKTTMSKTFIIAKQNWEVVVQYNEDTFWTVVFYNKGLFLMILLNIFVPSILIFFVGKSISKRLSLVASHMDRVEKEQFIEIESFMGDDEIGKLITSYNLMVAKIRNLINVVYRDQAEKQALDLSKKQAELKAIQSQVNPHFLFNTLEAIRMRSLIKGENETANIIEELSALFRMSMTWDKDYISIDDELSFVKKYINIQRYRFGDKLKYIANVMKECRQDLVPKLAIVTFVENAFIHGIESSVKDGVITLNITKDTDYLIINVLDNGKGIEEEKLKEMRQMLSTANSKMLYNAKSTGILNALLRFKMYSDGEVVFGIESKLDHGTSITVKLPIKIVTDDIKTSSLDKGDFDNDQCDDC
ncbi:MAG: sensor histidine kinase [Clostridiales bacterium]|nr:sensor histidine kinase [Clostridiales bacterium]